MNYKVSVVIPVYGVEKYIERCARSLFEQTLDEIEYIFVDDCSQDKSIEILEKVASEYPKRKQDFSIIHHAQNLGLAAARVTGLSHCHGEYVIQCDSDDWIDKDTYREMYSKAKKNNADVVICDFFSSDGKVNKKITITHPTERLEWIKDMFYHKTSWALWNKLFKRSLYHNNITYPKYSMGEDSVVVMQLAYFCNTIVYTDLPLYYYFNNPNSIVNSKKEDKRYQKFIEALDNCQIIERFYKEKGKQTLKNCINFLYYYTKNTLLLPLIWKEKYKEIWCRTFPGIEREILKDSHISSKERIRCLLIILKIYPRITNTLGLTKCK
jgi:glycosyltransferase involved in cell wall biosynthesis